MRLWRLPLASNVDELNQSEIVRTCIVIGPSALASDFDNLVLLDRKRSQKKMETFWLVLPTPIPSPFLWLCLRPPIFGFHQVISSLATPLTTQQFWPTTNNSQHCWELLRPFASSLTGFKLCEITSNNTVKQHVLYATGTANGTQHITSGQHCCVRFQGALGILTLILNNC